MSLFAVACQESGDMYILFKASCILKITGRDGGYECEKSNIIFLFDDNVR